MNLVNDPWIPVILQDKSSATVSLRDIFTRGETIADLAANPCQRIALMRLLICVAQAALDGPADEAEWRTCRGRLASAALAYLDKWQHRFNLFGEHAFLQVDGLENPDDSFVKPITTLDATSANGGTGLTMLWDHAATSSESSVDEIAIPLFLLCYLNFSCSGKVGKAQWRGSVFNGSAATAPSHNFLHTYLLGRNIVDTIHFNLVSKEIVKSSVCVGDFTKWGNPVWESMPKSPDDKDAMCNAAETYLGRLVPLSRLVLLMKHDGRRYSCMVGPPPECLKMKRIPFLREPAATVRLSKKDGAPYYLSAKAGRHIWRDLEAILALDQEGGTLALLPFMQTFVFPQQTTCFRVWIGGSVRGDNEGKYDDLVEWSAELPSACFLDRSLTAYKTGISLAEQTEGCLRAALEKYNQPICDKPAKGNIKFIRDSKQIPYNLAKTLYWQSLDGSFSVLLEAVEKNTVLSFEAWRRVIDSALRAAYAQTCPHATPRQIQAYARGLKVIEDWKRKRAQ